MKSELIDAYLSGDLSGDSEKFVAQALKNDADLRDRYFEQLRMHEALKILLEDEEATADFAGSVVAHLKSEGADIEKGADRGFAKSVLTEILEERQIAARLRWPDMVKAGMVAAVAAVLVVLGLQRVSLDDSGFQTREGTKKSAQSFVARVTGVDNVIWEEKTAASVRKDGWISAREVVLQSGVAELTFNSGARVFLEGPAKLSLEHSNRGYLEYGRLTAEVPSRASGFVINTPRLNVVDIGTRFGVSVAPNGDTEVHVMQGVVEASRASGNSVPIRLTEGLALKADSRTRSDLQVITYAGENFTLDVPEALAVEGESGFIHYDFDESSGSAVEDSGLGIYRGPFDTSLTSDSAQSGNFEMPRRAPGRVGGGLVFQPGEGLVARMPNEILLDEAFTASFWVKISPRGPQGEKTAVAVLGRPESGNWKISWNQNSGNGAKNALRVDYGRGRIVGTTDIRDGQWHHVTVRFLGGEKPDIATHIHLFVDGELESVSGVVSASIKTDRAGQLQLGSFGETGFEGWIDEFYLHRGAIAEPVVDLNEQISFSLENTP